MLKDLSIKKKLASGFGAIVAIIVILLAMAYTNFTRLSDASAWDLHTMHVLQEASQIETAIVQIQSSTRGFLLTGDASAAQRIRAEEATLRSHQAAITKLTADNPGQQARLQKLAAFLDNWLNQVIRPQLERRSTGAQAAMADEVQAGGRAMAEARALIKDVTDEESRLLTERTRTTSGLAESMMLLLVLGGAVCTVLALIIGAVLLQALGGPISRLAAVVERIAHGDQDARVEVSSRDELGQMSNGFNLMAQAIQDSQQKELAASDLLRSKVDSLLGVVSKAAAGDLTGKITVQGNDAIGQLADGVIALYRDLAGQVAGGSFRHHAQQRVHLGPEQVGRCQLFLLAVLDGLRHQVEAVRHLAQFIARADFHARILVAVGDAFHHRSQAADRAAQGL
jgi:methyl-accepting chemotaxis protein WspA